MVNFLLALQPKAYTASCHLSAQLFMVSKAKVAVLCVLQVVCAALVVLSTDRRRLGGAARENVNTFASNTFDRAMQARKTNWFRKKMRCDRKTFIAIVSLVRARRVGKIHLNAKRVAVTLLYLASCGSIDNSATLIGMSKTSAVAYIQEVLLVLSRMAKTTIEMPNSDVDIESVRRGFESIAGFPDVIGAIDRSLNRICRPADHECWYCRKNYPAINMQAVVDHRAAFRSFSIRCGSMNDQALWNLSGLRTKTTVPAGMHLICDAGYKIYRHLLISYAEVAAASCPKKKCYNFKLSQTRITMERTFGILTLSLPEILVRLVGPHLSCNLADGRLWLVKIQAPWVWCRDHQGD